MSECICLLILSAALLQSSFMLVNRLCILLLLPITFTDFFTATQVPVPNTYQHLPVQALDIIFRILPFPKNSQSLLSSLML